VPVDLHRRFDGADLLAALVPHPKDHIADVTFYKMARSDLSRRADNCLHGSVHAVEIGALIISHALCATVKVEVDLLWASADGSYVGWIPAVTPWLRALFETLSQGNSGEEALHQLRGHQPPTAPESLFGRTEYPPEQGSCLNQSKQAVDVGMLCVQQIHLRDVVGPLTNTKTQGLAIIKRV